MYIYFSRFRECVACITLASGCDVHSYFFGAFFGTFGRLRGIYVLNTLLRQPRNYRKLGSLYQ